MRWLTVLTDDKDVIAGYNEGKGERDAERGSGVETRPHNAICYRAAIPPGSKAVNTVRLSGQDELYRFNAAAVAELYRRGIIE
jgi:hypothetical protein